MSKLSNSQKYMLKLIAKDSVCPEGWAKVSSMVMPLIQSLPTELVEWHKEEDGSGRVMLTTEGKAVVRWL